MREEFQGFSVRVEPDSDSLGYISKALITPENPPCSYPIPPVLIRLGDTHFIRQGEKVLKITIHGEVLVENSKQAS